MNHRHYLLLETVPQPTHGLVPMDRLSSSLASVLGVYLLSGPAEVHSCNFCPSCLAALTEHCASIVQPAAGCFSSPPHILPERDSALRVFGPEFLYSFTNGYIGSLLHHGLSAPFGFLESLLLWMWACNCFLESLLSHCFGKGIFCAF